MRGLGYLFVAGCMALIALSVGLVLSFVAGFSGIESTMIALVALFGLLTLEVTASRGRDRSGINERFEGLSRASADLAREIGELRHRMAALETAPKKERELAVAPLSREIAEVAKLVEEIAQTVAVHDTLLTAPRKPHTGETAQEPAGAAAPVPAAPPLPGPFENMTGAEILVLVRGAVESGNIELFLQPVVTLPQRKVRYYEALSRMRLSNGVMVDAADFIPVAKKAGLLPRVDERLVHNCVQVVRRLAAKNREVGLFLNIAPETLGDKAVFSEILGYLDANRALAPSLMLEMSQLVYRTLGSVELNSMSQLAERGFRFSLDRIDDFRIDPRALAERGVRFMKVPADLMLKQMQQTGGAHIHPADLSDLLGRHGIDLVADRIESENIVVDLLDYDVRFGQGFLFAPPRPVRADILKGEGNEPAGGGGITATPPAPESGYTQAPLSALARKPRLA
jgi:cyclic-di-GMP phosphodiesterase TipF (flagellum assembly factor)